MNTTPDHKDFITRQHRNVDQATVDNQKEPRKCSLMLIVWGVLSVFFFILLGALTYEIYNVRALPLNDLRVLVAIWLVSVVGLVIFASRMKYVLLNPYHSFDTKVLDSVLEGSRGARLVTDPSDKAIYYNRRFQKLCKGMGVPGLDALSKLFTQNDQARTHFASLADSAHRGLEGSIDLQTTLDGQDYWFLVTAQPVQNWAGYIHWRIDDETQKYYARQAKDEEREKLIDFTDNAPVGFFSVNEEGRFIFANATFARWLGVDLDTLFNDVVLHSFLENIPVDAHPYDIISGGGARQVAEVCLKGPAGKIFKASVSQTVVMNDDKNVRTRAVVHDISAESAMRHALKLSEDRFARFFEEAPLGIIMIDPEHRIQDSNKAFSELTGYDTQSVKGAEFLSFIHEDDRRAMTQRLSKVSACDNVEVMQDVRLKLVCANDETQDDKYVYSIVYGRHFASLQGDDNIVLHFLDTSEKKSLEQQFAQSQKMQAVGQLAGGVAHDFNNLLTAMIGFCDLLLLRHKPGDPSFQDIMQIKQNSNRASNLVRQLLAFSRQQTLRPKVQDVTDILTEVSHLVRRLLGANVELEMTHGESLGLVRVDGGQMEQVIINMAVNARDAMDGAGRLKIDTSHFSNRKAVKIGDDEMEPGHWVKITISDTGSGISPEVMERIFEPFFTTKDVGKGTGLGLATVYGIIRQTGGFLDVDSVVGEGTSFIIYLPVAQEVDDSEDDIADVTVESRQADDAPKPMDLTGTAKILLVEDEDAVRNFSERALNNKGYDVVGADCGESAIEMIEEHGIDTFDLVITDVIMPNMDGPTLANKIREISPKMRIIFVSGYTEEKLKEHMGENIYFLPKPFSLKQLAEKVKEVLS
jgi:two-component system cell cycle sensor histidine kinase/response regulator CckA|tara:strand:- start:245200 stop:247794 length:2595 start_codon:yes stop_codon:yes gene_type:complete